MKSLLFVMLSLGLALWLSGCATPAPTPYREVPDFPKWEDPWGFSRDPALRDWGTMPYYNPYLQ
ncbi:MAG: hypothetical protein K6T55_07330 [Syntrophobacterales bacterium]|nr:hypothetical protein [Syntrophobacterales bacterium]